MDEVGSLSAFSDESKTLREVMHFASQHVDEVVEKTSRLPFIEEMTPEDAQRYDQWNKLVADGLSPEQRMWVQDYGTPNTYFEFKKYNPSQNISDYQDLVLNQSPWPKGYSPQKITLKPGDTFEMAMGPEKVQPNDWPGGFGTEVGTITNKEYVYNNLAVKSDWKPELERVVQYRVKDGVELPVQVGPVGPQIDVQVDKYLPGGASQSGMLVDPMSRMDYLDIVSVRYFE